MSSLLYDVVHLRDIFLRDKRFLIDLYTNNLYQNKKLISSATQQHLNTLLKILHLVANNEIPIQKPEFDVIKKAKKVGLLKKRIKNNKDFLALLEEAEEKRIFVQRFAGVFKALLKPFFEEDY
jgi:hypothetical protein